MNKFLIFTDARTGSISLAKIISSAYNNKLPHKIITEPFCKDSIKNFYPDLHKKLETELYSINEEEKAWKVEPKQMEKILDTCFEHSHGIKHIWGHLDLRGKMQNEFIINYAVRKKIKIILLSRNNFVLKSLSLIMAKQSHVWSADEKNEIAAAAEFKYERVDMEELERIIKEYVKYLYRYKIILSPFKHYDIAYEDFFKTSLKNAREEDIRKLQDEEILKIFKFLGMHSKNLDKETVDFYLNPTRNQNKNIYKLVPNIKEVIKYSKENWDKDLSWLLKE